MAKKPRIVIIGAGMVGLAAANKLWIASRNEFEVLVVKASTGIRGRIKTSESGRDRIQLGATWIHRVGGSPVYEIVERIGCSVQTGSGNVWTACSRWRTVAEDSLEVSRAVSQPISGLFDSLMDFMQGKVKAGGDGARSSSSQEEKEEFHKIMACGLKAGRGMSTMNSSIGSFLRMGLEIYWGKNGCAKNSRRKLDEEAVFSMNENIQRTYTSVGDLSSLHFWSESEYVMCSGEEITIAKGYSSVIQSLVSVLPPGTIQLGREVVKIEWHLSTDVLANWHTDRCPVMLHFRDGATFSPSCKWPSIDPTRNSITKQCCCGCGGRRSSAQSAATPASFSRGSRGRRPSERGQLHAFIILRPRSEV